jgi:uncharacterized protein (DUF2141 family)
MKFAKYLHWLLYLLFLGSCARQSQPTGGPKDTIPPILIRSTPRNEEINFKGKSIELTFSEMVVLNAPKEQILITPTIGKDYEVTVKNTKVILTYPNDLKDSTTYTFNFRDAVQDITEKNPVKNLKLAISTGSYIDSLSISGAVLNLPQQQYIKDATVALQLYSDTFSILKHAPTYFTRTDEAGKWKIDNLKPGLYSVYAFTDQNKNLIVDSKSERYGFLSKPLQLDSTITGVILNIVKLDARPLKLTSARPYNTYYNIRSAKNLKNAIITAADSSFLNYAFGADFANIQLYNSFNNIDSLQISVTLEDSIQNKLDTTLFAKFTTKEVTPEKFTSRLKTASLIADKGALKAAIQFNKPLKEVDFDSIRFIVDSLNTITFAQQNLNYDQLTKTLTIEKKIDAKFYKTDPVSTDNESTLKQGGQGRTNTKMINKLSLGKGAFISIEQDSSNRITQPVKPQKFEDLGVIIIQTHLKTSNQVIQLLDKKNEVIASVKNKPNTTFDDLSPDDYTIRVIIDDNGNGVWDPGNYLKKQEPEKIIYYENENGDRVVKLKANFEIGPLLITY